MGKKVWRIGEVDEQHTVDLQWNPFTAGGEVSLDGQTIQKWGWSWRSKKIDFNIGGGPATLIFENNIFTPNKQQLYVDGNLVQPQK
jgi:hypothetical protein